MVSEDLHEKKVIEVAKLCSDISTCNNLDNFLLKSSTANSFSNIFLKTIVIEKSGEKKFIPFTSFPQNVGSYLFHIKDVFDLSELGESKKVFESIAEIIEKKEFDFKDKFTGLPNAEGFVQALVNSALNFNESKSSFIAFKITHKNLNSDIDKRYIQEIAKGILESNILSSEDIFARWSYNVFCFLIIPDDKYERGLKVQDLIRNYLLNYSQKNKLDVNINIGIHRLPKGSIEFDSKSCELDLSYQDEKMAKVLNQTKFKEFILKTFKAMTKAIDTTFIVGNSVYKDIYTKEFIPITRVSTETILKNVTRSQ